MLIVHAYDVCHLSSIVLIYISSVTIITGTIARLERSLQKQREQLIGRYTNDDLMQSILSSLSFHHIILYIIIIIIIYIIITIILIITTPITTMTIIISQHYYRCDGGTGAKGFGGKIESLKGLR